MKRAVAKLFKNGGSQAVRLPMECRFPDGESEVFARREGERVILEPVGTWPVGFFDQMRAGEQLVRSAQQPLSAWENPFAAKAPGKRRKR